MFGERVSLRFITSTFGSGSLRFTNFALDESADDDDADPLSVSAALVDKDLTIIIIVFPFYMERLGSSDFFRSFDLVVPLASSISFVRL